MTWPTERDGAQDRSADVGRLFQKLGRPLSATAINAVPGGLSNDVYRAHVDGTDWIVKFPPDEGPECRAKVRHEATCTALEAERGIAPPILKRVPSEALVVRFVEGKPIDAETARTPAGLVLVADILRKIHDGPALPATYEPFTDTRRRLATAEAHRALSRAAYENMLSVLDAIERAVEPGKDGLVPSHNDFHPLNILVGAQTWVIDWERGGMSDGFWDLAYFASMTDLDAPQREALLKNYLGVDALPPGEAARLHLWSVVADIRLYAWCVFSIANGSRADYTGLSAKYAGRVQCVSDTDQLEAWLELAQDRSDPSASRGPRT